MSGTNEKNSLLQVRMPASLLANAKRLARKKGMPTSDYVRSALTSQLLLDSLSEDEYALRIEIGEPYGVGRLDRDEFEISATIEFKNMSFLFSDHAAFYLNHPLCFKLPEFSEDNHEPYRIDSFYYCRIVFPGAYNNKGRLLGAKFNRVEDSFCLSWKGAVFLYTNMHKDQPKEAFNAVKLALEESIRNSIDTYINSIYSLLGAEYNTFNASASGLFFKKINSLLNINRCIRDDYGAWQFELVCLIDKDPVSNSMLTQLPIPKLKHRYIHFDARYADVRAINGDDFDVAFKFSDGIARGYIYSSGISEEDNPTGFLEISNEFERIISTKLAKVTPLK